MLRPQFLCFGDSLTQQAFDVNGWGTMLAYKYVRKVDVLNRGYSGYNTRWALQSIDKIFSNDFKQPPKLVTVFFGANDAAPPNGPDSKQHVPLEEYKDNLIKIHEYIKQHGATNILYISPTPVDDEVLEGARQYKYTEQYAKICLDIGEKLDLQVLDLWTYMQKQKNWQKNLLSDGVHFTDMGNKIVFEALTEFIDQTFPGLSEKQFEYDLPLWREIS